MHNRSGYFKSMQESSEDGREAIQLRVATIKCAGTKNSDSDARATSASAVSKVTGRSGNYFASSCCSISSSSKTRAIAGQNGNFAEAFTPKLRFRLSPRE